MAPIAVIAAIVVVVAFGVFATEAFGSGGKSGTSGVSSAQSSSQSSAASTGKTNSSKLTENAANRISPKEDIVISDVNISTDAINRYVITGKVTNKSSQDYETKLTFSGKRHKSDKYGEEVVEDCNISDFETITPFCDASGSLRIYDLGAGETRSFTIYPYWGSIEETLDNVIAEVEEVKLTDIERTTRFNHDGAIKITNLQYTADGKISGDYTNDSGMYLDDFTIVVLPYGKEGLPNVKSSSGARPTGTKLFSTSIRTLKPGDSGTFEMKIGEGYDSVNLVHVVYTPDKNKDGWK